MTSYIRHRVELLCGPSVDGMWDWVEVEEEPWVHDTLEVHDLDLAVAGLLHLGARLTVQVATVKKT